jgi:hypothetical protein
LEALRQESNATKYLEAKLAATMTAVENLEKEIILAKESQSTVAKAVSNANDILAKVSLMWQSIIVLRHLFKCSWQSEACGSNSITEDHI